MQLQIDKTLELYLQNNQLTQINLQTYKKINSNKTDSKSKNTNWLTIRSPHLFLYLKLYEWSSKHSWKIHTMIKLGIESKCFCNKIKLCFFAIISTAEAVLFSLTHIYTHTEQKETRTRTTGSLPRCCSIRAQPSLATWATTATSKDLNRHLMGPAIVPRCSNEELRSLLSARLHIQFLNSSFIPSFL